jgi:hypothetical protein
MIAWGLLLALASPTHAQVAPALTEAPAPVGAVQPSNVDELFSRFTSGRPMIPTLKEVQAEQLKRDLAPRKEAGGVTLEIPGRSDFGHFNQPPMQGVRRDSTESVDVAVSRPMRRVELGTGFSEEDVNVGTRRISGSTSQYGFLRIDLARAPLARKLFHSPTAVHTETETQDDHVHVSKDEYTTDFLKHPH